jgi:hypothetical protein
MDAFLFLTVMFSDQVSFTIGTEDVYPHCLYLHLIVVVGLECF